MYALSCSISTAFAVFNVSPGGCDGAAHAGAGGATYAVAGGCGGGPGGPPDEPAEFMIANAVELLPGLVATGK